MFQQSTANLNFFAYRLHNETLDKKIYSTHDYQDYYNSLGVEIQEISPLALTHYFKDKQSAWQ